MKKLIFLSLIFATFSFIANAQLDPTGDDWVTPPAGPTFTLNPLVGIGTATPAVKLDVLDGNINISSTGAHLDPEIRIWSEDGLGTSSYRIRDLAGTQLRLDKRSAAGPALIDYNPMPLDNLGPASFRFFRNTNTTGDVFFSVYKGNNTATLNGQIGGNIDTYFAADNGNVGIGTALPTNKFSVVGISDFTGNVGIGTTTPGTALDVAGVITATGGTSTLWNMAHGWGDHSLAGYSSGAHFTPSTLIADYGFTDNSANWNTAFGWGDHAGAGYLTSETDPQVGTNSTNYVPKWNGSAIVTGTMYDDGSDIGIGTTSPYNLLSVKRNVAPSSTAGAFIDIQNSSGSSGALSGIRLKSNGTSGNDRFHAAIFHSYTAGLDYQLNFAVRDNATSSNVSTGDIKMTVLHDGNVGIGTTSPDNQLHVSNDIQVDGRLLLNLSSYSNSWAAAALYKPGTGGSTIQCMNDNSGTGAGDGASIGLSDGITPYAFVNNWETGGIRFLTGFANRMTIEDGGNVGIGTATPTAKLHVDGGTADQYGMRVDNDYTGASTKYGMYNQTDAGGTGTRYGFFNDTDGNGTDASSVYGNYNTTTSNGSSASVYGVYSVVSTSGTGNRYAIYGSASTGEPNPGVTRSWAGYFSGNTYFTSDVRMGYTADVPGYKLAVNGKIICEELLVQDSGSWPDYVFDKEYDLWSLEDINKYIKINNHLPGVPDADCIENEGISVGEMSKIMMEKIEELTLHMIEQSKQIKALQDENVELKQKMNQ